MAQHDTTGWIRLEQNLVKIFETAKTQKKTNQSELKKRTKPNVIANDRITHSLKETRCFIDTIGKSPITRESLLSNLPLYTAISDFYSQLKKITPSQYQNHLGRLTPDEILDIEIFQIISLCLFCQIHLKVSTATENQLSLPELFDLFWNENFTALSPTSLNATQVKIKDRHLTFLPNPSLDSCELFIKELQTIYSYCNFSVIWKLKTTQAKIDKRCYTEKTPMRTYFFLQLLYRQSTLPALYLQALSPANTSLFNKVLAQCAHKITIDLRLKSHYSDEKIATILTTLKGVSSNTQIQVLLGSVKQVGKKTQQAIAQLQLITALDLEGNQMVDDRVVQAIFSPQQTGIRQINLQRTLVGKMGPEGLLPVLSQLEKLDLSWTRIDHSYLRTLALRSSNTPNKMKELALNGCSNINALALLPLQDLAPQLERFAIAQSKIQFSPDAVKRLPKTLTHLDAQWVRGLDADCIKCLLQHTLNLHSLNVGHCAQFDSRALLALAIGRKFTPSQLNLNYCHNIDCGALETFFSNPNVDFSSIDSLHLLAHLLSDKTLQAIYALRTLSNLSLEYTSHAKLFRHPWKALKKLTLNTNPIFSLCQHDSFFLESPIQELHLLNMSTLQYEDEIILSQMQHLRFLNICGHSKEGVHFEGALETLSSLPHLETLELALANGIGMKEIETIIMSCKKLSTITLGPMRSLTGQKILKLKQKIPHIQIKAYGTSLA